MRIWRIAQVRRIGPVYHGTVYKFKAQDLSGDPLFFTDDRNFAYDYASQKSFDAKMDADIVIIEAYISGKVFDPQNKMDVETIVPYLQDTITVYNDFGMDAKIPLNLWKQLITGTYTVLPYWSEKDLAGKQPGDRLPANDVYDKPLLYQLVELTPDKVYYLDGHFVADVLNGRYTFYHSKERLNNMSKTEQEVIYDLKNMDELAFIKKYGLYNDLHYFPHIFSRTRHPETTENNDVWRWLEGDGIFDAIRKAGFDIVKSRESGKTTYAVFKTADVNIVE